MKRVLYFGTYSKGGGYPRNTVIIDALRDAGAEVHECHVPMFRDAREKVAAAKGGLRFVARALKAWAKLAAHHRTVPAHDLVVVGYTGHIDIHLARLLSRKPIVLDAFLSPWDTVVNDRKLFAANSIRGRMLFRAERSALKKADLVLTDTAAHSEFMAETFGVARDKFHAVPVGSLTRVPVFAGLDADCAAPALRPLRAFFCGSFVPLQGVPIILDAATLAPEIDFHIVGDGPGAELIEEEVAMRGMPNVQLERRFIGRAELENRIEDCDVVLGVFGDAEKTGRVVPCKVYDGLAAGRPVLTGDGPAPREILRDGEEAILVERGSPTAIVAGLRRLQDPALRARIAEGGRHAFDTRFSTSTIGGSLLRRFEEVTR
jgi:glycosyltransferase involved in cell wall biosynthesis